VRRLPIALDSFLHATVLARSIAQMTTDLPAFESYNHVGLWVPAWVIGWVGILLGIAGVVAAAAGGYRARAAIAAVTGGYCAMFSHSFALAGNWSASAYVACFALGFAFSVIQLGRRVW